MKPNTPAMKSTTAAKTAHPLGSGTDLPAMSLVLSIGLREPEHRVGTGDRTSPARDDGPPRGQHGVDGLLDRRVDGHGHGAAVGGLQDVAHLADVARDGEGDAATRAPQ
jgi:hypothetical protein